MVRFGALDGLRGVSAVAVLCFHMPLAFHLFGSPLVREAYMFVDFFFVLSGFVIAHAYGSRLGSAAGLRDFLLRRVGRLWPLHLVTLGAVLALECGLYWLATQRGLSLEPAFTGERSLDLLVPNALLLHGWAPLRLSWNSPSWSISAELLAYLVFGLTMILAGRRALAAAACILGVTWFVSLSIAPNDTLYAGFPGLRAICGFFAGVLVHAAFAGGGRPGWSKMLGTMLEIGAVLLVVAFLVLVSRKETTPWAMPIFAATIYVFAAERGALSTLLNTALFQRLGQLSYSIYLTHFLVITAFWSGTRLIGLAFGLDVTTRSGDLFPSTLDRGPDWILVDFGNFWLNDLAALAIIATVLCVSAVTWRTVEQPGQRLFAALLRRPARRRETGEIEITPAAAP